MSTRLSALQITDATDWKGLTTENHLASLRLLEPQKLDDIVTAVFSKSFGNNIDSILSQFSTHMVDTDDDFIWHLMSQSLDNVALVECRIAGVAVTAADEPGKNFSAFELVFGKNFFSDTEVIVGEKNELYPIHITKEPYQDGNNWVFTCEMQTGDTNLFFPYDESRPGKLFSGEYSPVERGRHRKGREIRFKTSFEMKNSFTHLRMTHKAEGNMVDRKLAGFHMGLDGSKKPIISWMQHEMMKFKLDFREDINRCYMFGRSNRASDGTFKNKGISGEVIRQGSGLREQMQSANTSYYNIFSITAFSRRLMDLAEGKLGIDQRKFVLRTGERGAYEFHKSLEANTQLYTLNQTTDRVYNVNQKGFQMGLGYGGQFVEYRGPNNQIISLSVDSMYDDKTRNKQNHPLGGLVESYRYDIMDFGTSDGKPNIQKVQQKGWSQVHKYIPGFMNPFDPISSLTAVATMENAWEESLMDKVAAVVRDPSRTMAYLPNLLAF